MLGQFSQVLPMTLDGSDDLHLLPVVGKFFAAIQTSDVGSGQRRGRRTALGATDGYGKAVMGMPAAKESLEQSSDHASTFHIRAGWLESLGLKSSCPPQNVQCGGSQYT